MSERDRIRDQMEQAYRGNAWHGSAVLELLKGVSAKHAAAHPIENAHSIAELVPHMETWKRVVRRRIAGETFTVSDAEDWPEVDVSKQGWTKALASLEAEHRRLVRAVGTLKSDAALNKLADQRGRTAYVLLHGVIQHDLYHAGQIALLKKALGLM
jgi:uncharacterized damage-inducible protein DinB